MIARLTGLAMLLVLGVVGTAQAVPEPETLIILKEANGNSPYGKFLDKDGNLYGVTGHGGNDKACPGLTKRNPGSSIVTVVARAGCGVVFKLSHVGKAWTETVLHAFALTDGAKPGGALIADSAGNFYGTANYGGKKSTACPGSEKNEVFPGCGLVFKLTPPAGTQKLWTRTILYEFSGKDGAVPDGDLVLDADGNLYGTTTRGGTSTTCPAATTKPYPAGCGVVFKLSPPAGAKKLWTETVLHNFGIGNDGKYPPFGVVQGKAGTLYGTTSAGGAVSSACPTGCGIVFRLSANPGTSAWSETILDSFGGQPKHPADPFGALLIDGKGNIYGTSYSGGAHTDTNSPMGEGTVYKLTAPTSAGGAWEETLLHSFGGTNDGQAPLTGLVSDAAGNLYGTTVGGGYFPPPSFSFGTVFKLSPPAARKTQWSETVLANFNYFGDNGVEPATQLVWGPGGALYGATSGGGGDMKVDTSNGTFFTVKQ